MWTALTESGMGLSSVEFDYLSCCWFIDGKYDGAASYAF